jgi:hypothetical protein
MKRNLIILSVLAIFFAVPGCRIVNEHAKTPDASFDIQQKDSNGVVHYHVDTIQMNTAFDLIHTGEKCDKVVYFTGAISYKFDVPTDKGKAADQFGKLVNNKLVNRFGNDTIYCVATNIGQWGDEIKQVHTFKILYIIKN